MHDYNLTFSSGFQFMNVSHFLWMNNNIYLVFNNKGQRIMSLSCFHESSEPSWWYLFRTIDLLASVETWVVTIADSGIQRSAELKALYDVYMEQSAGFEQREDSAASTQENSQGSTSSLQKV